MFREENLVKPDPRKGTISLFKSDDLTHFCWIDRATGKIEDELIVFPDDAKFEKVPQCTTGRVYVLHMPSCQARHFFWLQEPKVDKDEEYCKVVNDFMNGADSTQTDELGTDELAQFLRNSSGSRPATTDAQPVARSQPPVQSQPPQTHSQASQSQPQAQSSQQGFSVSMLNNILSGLSNQNPQSQDVDLNSILTPENIAPLLEDNEVVQRLFPFLPEKANRSKEEIQDIIRSPQFVQAVASLNAGLQSGMLGPLIAELGLDPSVGSAFGGVDAFIRAIQAKNDEKKNQK